MSPLRRTVAACLLKCQDALLAAVVHCDTAADLPYSSP